MNLFSVYTLFDITPDTAKGVYVYDVNGIEYLDLYGGHGVISIGHSHPGYIAKVTEQLNKIGFYSNSVNIPIQEELAQKLGTLSGYQDYNLFLCNSGAEANENALKLASFHNGKKHVVAFRNSFHGRTAATLNATDNPKISAPLNKQNFPVTFVELNNHDQLMSALSGNDVCAVIVEGIQGVGGLDFPDEHFLQFLSEQCKKSGALLILDEIQSGYGRSGQFFAHQQAEVKPDIITIAKGMGNGFPVAGIMIDPAIKAEIGMLGTTFGGSHLACAAAISVLDTIAHEDLINNAANVGNLLTAELMQIPQIRKIKGRGLMLGIELDEPVAELRHKLLFDHQIFTGASANPNLMRILPPLSISFEQLRPFVNALKLLLQ